MIQHKISNESSTHKLQSIIKKHLTLTSLKPGKKIISIQFKLR